MGENDKIAEPSMGDIVHDLNVCAATYHTRWNALLPTCMDWSRSTPGQYACAREYQVSIVLANEVRQYSIHSVAYIQLCITFYELGKKMQEIMT